MSTFCRWRLDNTEYNDAQLELIAHASPDVLALQNISQAYYASLKQSGYFSYSCFQRSTSGVGHAIFSQYPLGDYYVVAPTLRDYPLVKYVALPAGMITLLVFSSSSSNGLDLSVLSQLSGPVVAATAALPCLFDMKQFQYIPESESVAGKLLVGATCEGLSDVYRRYVVLNPSLKHAVQSLRPRGPIVRASVKRGERRCTTEFILANNKLLTYHCNYYLNEACATGVDYALIAADLVVDHPAAHPFLSRFQPKQLAYEN